MYGKGRLTRHFPVGRHYPKQIGWQALLQRQKYPVHIAIASQCHLHESKRSVRRYEVAPTALHLRDSEQVDAAASNAGDILGLGIVSATVVGEELGNRGKAAAPGDHRGPDGRPLTRWRLGGGVAVVGAAERTNKRRSLPLALVPGGRSQRNRAAGVPSGSAVASGRRLGSPDNGGVLGLTHASWVGLVQAGRFQSAAPDVKLALRGRLRSGPQ